MLCININNVRPHSGSGFVCLVDTTERQKHNRDRAKYDFKIVILQISSKYIGMREVKEEDLRGLAECFKGLPDGVGDLMKCIEPYTQPEICE